MPLKRIKPFSFNTLKILLMYENGSLCQLCEKTFASLHLHHINGNCNFNALSNLSLLCDSCHKHTHIFNIQTPSILDFLPPTKLHWLRLKFPYTNEI